MLNVNVVPESGRAASQTPFSRGRAAKGPMDDFALMLAQTSAVAKPKGPAAWVADETAEGGEVEDAAVVEPVEPEPAGDVEDAEPESDVAAEGEPAVLMAAASAAATAEKRVLADVQKIVATTNDESAAAAPVDKVAVAVPAADVMPVTVPASTAPQAALPAMPPAAEPPASAAPAPAAVDGAAEPAAPAGKLLIEAPEPGVPVKPSETPVPEAAVAKPDAAAGDSKAMLPVAPAAKPVSAKPTPPVAPAATAVSETAAPGASAVQSTLAAAVRDGAPRPAVVDSPAPSPMPAGDGPAAAQPAPGQSVAGQVSRGEAALPAAGGAVAVTLENVGQYVVRSVRLMGQEGQKTLTVRLIPASLGELRLEVTTVRDGVQVRLMSANPVVREALESQLGSLRDTLARSGVEASSVTVSAGSPDAGSHNMLAGARHEGAAPRPGFQNNSEQNSAAPHQGGRRPRPHQGVLDVSV